MKKNHDLKIKLDLFEKQQLKKYAESLGLKMTEYARRCCLKKIINTNEKQR